MTALLVDGSNLLVRCIKATERSGLHSGETSTGAITAFIGSVARLVKTYTPHYRLGGDHMVVCWDHGPSKRRIALFPEYKQARREDGAVGETKQNPLVFSQAGQFLRYAGIEQAEVEGYEADDVLAAYWATHDGVKVIVSGDKDFLQLVGGDTVQARPDGMGGYKIWDCPEVLEKFGCYPEQLPQLMALMGDTSDGIPGVYGLGPKKALSGLQEADWDLSRVAALQKDPAKAEIAALSLALVTLRDTSMHPQVPALKPLALVDHLSPAEEQDRLATFFLSLDMEQTAARLFTGTLWK